jgi:hypothetical protein
MTGGYTLHIAGKQDVTDIESFEVLAGGVLLVTSVPEPPFERCWRSRLYAPGTWTSLECAR